MSTNCASEQRMTRLSGGELGLDSRPCTEEIWASDQWRELFAFGKSERLEFEQVSNGYIPITRRPAGDVKALTDCGGYETEYRVVLPMDACADRPRSRRVRRQGKPQSAALPVAQAQGRQAPDIMGG
jgi:hypothetical protein